MGPPLREPWMWLPRSLLLSPAYAGLSRPGLRVLTRLCIENMDHAGRENGQLAVSYNEFEAFGIERRSISKALDELDELGFVRRSEAGRRAYGADPGRVATYRLTFAGTVGLAGAGPTDEWRRIMDADVARWQSRCAPPPPGGAGPSSTNGLRRPDTGKTPSELRRLLSQMLSQHRVNLPENPLNHCFYWCRKRDSNPRPRHYE